MEYRGDRKTCLRQTGFRLNGGVRHIKGRSSITMRRSCASFGTQAPCSSGTGAATAAGLVGFSVGTETLGSIVSPAATNGVVGLRPTYGRVSRYGVMPLSWTMDKAGPICRTVEDCALVFDAILGADPLDASAVDAPFKFSAHSSVKGKKAGVLRDEFNSPNDPEVARIFSAALKSLESLGAILEDVQLDEHRALHHEYRSGLCLRTALEDWQN